MSAPRFSLGQGRTESGHAAFRLKVQPGIALYVFDPAGELAPRAVVRTGDDRRTPLALTDDAGRATLGIATDRPTIFDFETPDRAVGQSAPIQPGSAADAAEGRVVAIRLVPADRIRGQVVDATSGPAVPNAAVWVSEAPGRRARADRFGAFQLDVWPGKGREAIQIAAAGYASAWATVSAPAVDLTISVTPAAPLSGWIVDDSGRPIAGADVLAEPRQARGVTLTEQAISGPDGRFWVADARHEVPYRLTVRAEGFPHTTKDVMPLPAGSSAEPQRIVMGKGRRGGGMVIDTESRPIPGARVELQLPPAMGTTRWSDHRPVKAATTDANGKFEFQALSHGSYLIRISHPDHGFHPVTTAEVPGRTGDADLGTFTLVRGLVLRGVVVDPDGLPVAGATVTGAHETRRRTVETRSAVTDADGLFTLSGLDSTLLDLLVSAEGHPPRLVQSVRRVTTRS